MKLTEAEVQNVAHLARLNVKKEESEKYQVTLGQIMTEIDKIIEAKIDEEEEILICPTENKNLYNGDEVSDMIGKKEAFCNSKNTNGDYIVVPKVLND